MMACVPLRTQGNQYENDSDSQSKGGVGKTAMLVHLAFYLSELGVKTVVVDLDAGQYVTNVG